jgi:triosephosphate isomerase (TIM)
LAAIKKPRIFVNFKTYKEGSGKQAELMAKCLFTASASRTVLVVQNADLYRVSRNVSMPVFAQHIDAAGYGQFTGHDVAGTLKDNGASGVLINHSEDRLAINEIKTAIKMCRDANLTSLVCAKNQAEAAKIARLRPDIVAIEPPELIATGIAVSRAKPAVVTKTVKAVKKVNKKILVLCGAGITTGEDVKKAIELGCSGVLVASAIMKSKKPKSVLQEFVAALPK